VIADWDRVSNLFAAVRLLDGPARRTFLDAACCGDTLLRNQVEALLAADAVDDDFLEPHAWARRDAGASPSIAARQAFEDRFEADFCGRTLGSYELFRLIGNGGMGAVYLARRSDGAFLKEVAVKVMAAPFLFARDRFHRERAVLARLDHPNITRLLDGGTTAEGLPYLVMEYVEGVQIDRYCASRDVSLDDRIGLLLQVCSGIAHAHQNLIVHCDIKPQNILVTDVGTVKLLDFGIAKLLDDAAASVTMLRPATPTYASPEHLRGDPLTTSSDVYSIGVLAYVLLANGWPYPVRSGRLDEIVQAVLAAEPMRASLVPGVEAARAHRLRGDLDNVLAKAVARDASRRYASVQQLADDLDAYRRGFPVRARRDTLAYRLTKLAGRHRVTTAAAVSGIIGLLSAATISGWQAHVANRRFQDLRQFAHTVVFDVNDSLTTVSGTTAARKLLVETGLQYLDRLSRERLWDVALREELAAAYVRIGKVQGGAFLPNLGDSTGAVVSFRKAIATIGPAPTTAGLERLRIEAHLNTGLLAADPIKGGPEFDAAIVAAQRLLDADPNDVRSLRLYADALHGRATIAHVTDHAVDHERISIQEIDARRKILALAPASWLDELGLARALAQHSLALGQRGDVDGSEAPLRSAMAIVEPALRRDPRNQLISRGLAEIRSRLAAVLAGLGRLAEASAELDAAIRLLDPLVASDRNNVQYAGDLAYARFRLAEVRQAEGHVVEAIALHRLALAVRRDRLVRDADFMFVPWELARSLNSLGELLLATSPPRAAESLQLFREASNVAARTVASAPSFNEVRKQLAIALQGLARASLALGGDRAKQARHFLDQSLNTWREVASRNAGDLRDTDALARAERLLATLPRDGGVQ